MYILGSSLDAALPNMLVKQLVQELFNQNLPSLYKNLDKNGEELMNT